MLMLNYAKGPHMDKSTINILIALVAVTLTLSGLIYGAFASLRHEMRSERIETRRELSEFRGELQAFRSEVNTRLLALEQSQSRLSGYREGFAEAVGIAAAGKVPGASDGR